MKKTIENLFVAFIFLHSAGGFAQNSYSLVNDATIYSGCNCFQLTPAHTNQGGGVYQDSTINLTYSFDYTFNVFLGCSTGGADGIVFILSNNITTIGATGGGMGYSGLTGNSVGVEFDTYQNGWDPPYNHIAIEVNGQVQHPTGTIAGPVSTLPGAGYVDDCQWHTARIVWDAVLKTYTVYFDGNLRLTYTGNIVANYFAGNPIVNWGWSGGTGALDNIQRVCTSRLSTWTAGSNYRSCNLTVPFSDISSSALGTVIGWSWNFGDSASGTNDTSSLRNPVHTYSDTGTYLATLVISDITSCPDTFQHVVVIKPPIALTPTITQPYCNGQPTGSIHLSTAGGFGSLPGYGGYRFHWSVAGTDSILSNLASGTYTVTVTDSLCTSTASYFVNQPPALQLSVLNRANDSCFGYCNGQLLVSATGGTPAYRFNWNDGTTGAKDSNLCANIYTVTLMDYNNCQTTLTDTVHQPASLLTIAIDSINVKCYGQATGQVSISATGGTPGYTYLWSNSSTGDTVRNLAAGTYTVAVKDSFGCGAAGRVNITQPPSAVSVQMDSINVNCFGQATGQASVRASGGSPGYTYLWSNSGTLDSITGLPAGSYSVTVKDSFGCSAAGTVNVSQPGRPDSVALTQLPLKCKGVNNAKAYAAAIGGTPAYTYLWNNGITTDSLTGLPAGTYTVTITDASNCTASGTLSIAISTDSVQLDSSTVAAACGLPNGSATISPSGGTAPYAFLWSNGKTTATIDSLALGDYAVTVTDASGCTGMLSVNVGQFPALIFNSEYADDTCGQHKGRASASVLSGVGPFTFNWIPAGTDTASLDSGMYVLIITDGKGCVTLDTFRIGNDESNCVTGLVFGNAFTPNGDHVNDYFIPVATPTLNKFHMTIYDRWGQLVFETNDATVGWDGNFKGKPQPLGMYLWFADYGFSDKPGIQYKTGTLSLFR